MAKAARHRRFCQSHRLRHQSLHNNLREAILLRRRILQVILRLLHHYPRLEHPEQHPVHRVRAQAQGQDHHLQGPQVHQARHRRALTASRAQYRRRFHSRT